MSEVSAVGKAHTHNRIIRLQQRKINSCICLRARMRLNIRKLSVKQLFGTFNCNILNDVNVLAAAVITLPRITFCVFVCQNTSHCRHNRRRNNVLTSNKFKVTLLARKLQSHSIGNFFVIFADKTNSIYQIVVHNNLLSRCCTYLLQYTAKYAFFQALF